METTRRMFKEGLIAGLIGYATIAAFYALLDLALGRSPVSTASTLGRDLVGSDLAGSMPWAPILAANGVHLVALLFVGMGASWVVYETERHPNLWFLAFLGGVLALFFTEGVLLLFAVPATTVLPWWSVILANLMAGGTMGFYLLRSHRLLVRRLNRMEREAL